MMTEVDGFPAGTRVELAWPPHHTGVVRYSWIAENGQPYVFVEWDDVWHMEGWDTASSVRSATSMRPQDVNRLTGVVTR